MNQPEVEDRLAGIGLSNAQSAHGEQERVARQEREQHQSRLGEDDDEKKPVHPWSVIPDELREKAGDIGEQMTERGIGNGTSIIIDIITIGYTILTR